jgi:transposase-like protein
MYGPNGGLGVRPVYVAVGVDFTGNKHVLGLWIGKDGEGARYWMSILAELRNRRVVDSSKRHIAQVTAGLKPIYTASSAAPRPRPSTPQAT